MSQHRVMNRAPRRVVAATVLTLAGLAVTTIVGVSGSLAGAAARPLKAKYTVAYIIPSAISSIFEQADGVKAEAQRLGMGYIQESLTINESLITAADSLIARHVNAIITIPNDPAAFASVVKAANKDGIRVLTYGGYVPGIAMEIDSPDSATAADLVKGLATKLRAEHKPCDLAVLDGLPAAPPLEARNVGFTAGIKAAKCTLVTSQVNTADSTAQAATIAQDWRTQYGNKITGIVTYNDDSTYGILTALNSSFRPLVGSMNGETQAVSDVQSGKIYLDEGEENAVVGEGLARGAYESLTGHSVPSLVTAPYVAITKANAATFAAHDADNAVLAKTPGAISFKKSGSSYVLTDSATN